MIRVMHIDDSGEDRKLVRTILELAGGFEFDEAENIEEMDVKLSNKPFDVIITDFWMEAFDGLTVLDHVKEHYPEIPVIFLTGTGSEEAAVLSLKQGAADYILKNPKHISRLPHIIENVIHNRQLERERLEALQKLKESEARYRSIVETGTEGVWIVNKQWATVFVNQQSLKMLGVSSKDVIGKKPIDFIFDEDKNIAALHFKQCENKQVAKFDARLLKPDGSQLWVMISLKPLWDEAGIFNGALAMLTDISERKKMESDYKQLSEQLRSYNHLSRMLIHRLYNLKEEQDNYLARTLQNEIGQSFSNIKMVLSSISQMLSEPSSRELLEKMQNQITELSALIDSSVNTLQRLCADLHPAVLDNTGIVATIESQAKDFAAKNNLKCNLTMPQIEVNLPMEAKISMFRIFQETLSNILRHANANCVSVNLVENANSAMLEVSDDGIGFDPATLSDDKALGLIGMRERAELCGGSIEIFSAPAKGTTVRVLMPKK